MDNAGEITMIIPDKEVTPLENTFSNVSKLWLYTTICKWYDLNN